MTVRGHEGGRGHREALKSFLINTRKRKVVDRKIEDDKTRMLAQIEKDAHEAMYGVGTYAGAGAGAGVGAGAGAGSGAGSGAGAGLRVATGSGSNRMPLPGGQWRPPPMPITQIFAGPAAGPTFTYGGGGTPTPAPAPLEDDIGDGVYDVDGAFFLMGEHKSASLLLLHGAPCEALVGDDWLPATVAGSLRDVPIPHTTLFSTQVTIVLAAGGAARDVPVSALRVPLAEETAEALRTAAVAVAVAAKVGRAEEEAPLDVVVARDEETGFGLWTALPVTAESDEAASATTTRKRARTTEEDGAAAARGGAGDKHKHDGATGPSLSSLHANPSKALDRLEAHNRGVGADANVDEAGDAGDDAFAAYNPYGGDTYKGFRLGEKKNINANAVVNAGSGSGAAAPAGHPIFEEKPKVEGGWTLLPTAPAPPPPSHTSQEKYHPGLPLIEAARLATPPIEAIAFKARAFNNAKGAARKRIDD